MSEYQYYEFLAIDRPLTATQQAELRALSTRAEITAVSFTNEYQWGDFKGDPARLMRRYFDAHVYFANWGTRRLMLRLPRGVVDTAMLEPYCIEFGLLDDMTETHRIIEWQINPEEPDYDEGPGEHWMARLIPLRDELARGDARSLYLGWLAAVTWGELEDDVPEPPVPPGLGDPTPAQLALADFLGIDSDLLAGAALVSPPRNVTEPTTDEVDAWLAAWPREELEQGVRLLLAGRSLEAEQVVKSRFAAWRRTIQPAPEATGSRRTVADLRRLADLARQAREKRKAEERARGEAERLKQRDTFLAGLAERPEPVWASAHQEAGRGNSAGYQAAARLIADLAEAHARYGSRALFDREMARFMDVHGRRRTLVERLVRAKVWKPK